MELVLDGKLTQPVREQFAVSILVFVELVLDVQQGIWGCSAVAWFQSLFSWNLFLMIPFPGGLRGLRNLVSILVFVELVLDVHWFCWG